MGIITLRAKLSGAVYCYRSCLWVCLQRADSVCYHDNSKFRALILQQTSALCKVCTYLLFTTYYLYLLTSPSNVNIKLRLWIAVGSVESYCLAGIPPDIMTNDIGGQTARRRGSAVAARTPISSVSEIIPLPVSTSHLSSSSAASGRIRRHPARCLSAEIQQQVERRRMHLTAWLYQVRAGRR